jgi:hypothetical protein
LGEGRLTLKAVEAFIDDVRVEKPVPQDLQRRATAYAHYRWASYCIHAEVANGCAMRQLLQALVDDWRLGPQVDRQTAKTSLTRVGLK